MKIRLKHRLLPVFITIPCLILYGLAYYFIGCPIRFLSGIPCPGCGLTRSLAALLSGDFRTSFAFHPGLIFFLILFILLLIFLICSAAGKADEKRRAWLLPALAFPITMILLIYIARLYFGMIP